MLVFLALMTLSNLKRLSHLLAPLPWALSAQIGLNIITYLFGMGFLEAPGFDSSAGHQGVVKRTSCPLAKWSVKVVSGGVGHCPLGSARLQPHYIKDPRDCCFLRGGFALST